jgi:glycosyltransferase involved in cell wall biosynthesis
MRICLLGEFSGNSDEGMKNVSKNIRDRLSSRNTILALNSRDFFRKKFLENVRSFQPEIIHYLHGPTIRSLIILRVAKRFSGNGTKTIVSATRPYFSRYSMWAVSLLKPHLVLTQSPGFEDFFKERGAHVQFLPNGVDCQKFKPISEAEKLDIRKEFGLISDIRIVLHVGHIKSNRNLEVLKEIQMIKDVQVVIVGGITETADEELKKDLQKVGIKIFHEFYDNISIFYKMADLYIFPPKDTGEKLPDSYNQVGAIDMPISVLEAMACNLPVITTTFSALPRIFEAGDGLTFCGNDGDILSAVNKTIKGVSINTRRKVMPYHWDRVIEQLERIYEKTIRNETVKARF